MFAAASEEHRWLQQLVGDWTYEVHAQMGPDKPEEVFHGKEHVRGLGELWVVCEGEGEMPDGDSMQTLMTLGFDPARGHFLGSWAGSMMTHMWIYDGGLDEARRVLTLDTTGPDFSPDAQPGATARYQDIIELTGENTRTLRSQMLGADGQWHQFMLAEYKRV